MSRVVAKFLALSFGIVTSLAFANPAAAGVCDTPPTPVCFDYDSTTKIVTLRPNGTLANWYFGVSLNGGSTYSSYSSQCTNCEGTERLASAPPTPAKFWITHKDPVSLGVCANKLYGQVNVGTGAFCTGSTSCSPTAHTRCYYGTPGMFTLSRGSGSSADNSTVQITWTDSLDATKYDVYMDNAKVISDQSTSVANQAYFYNLCGSHIWYVRAKNKGTSTTPSNSITIASPPCPGTNYYALSRCPSDGTTYYTTTVINLTAQRVLSGGGFYYLWTGTKITSSSPPANTIGAVSVLSGQFGCP